MFAVPLNDTEAHTTGVYSDEYFFGGGDGYPDYLDNADLLVKRGRRYARLLNDYMSPGSVLDIGAAAGFVLQGFERENWRGTGLEPNARMVTFGREELGLNLHCGQLETWSTESKFDLITMIQVIAHFSDLRQALARLSELTSENGFVLIETWDRKSLTARLFGEKWHEFSPPSVLHWFSREELKDVMRDYGFRHVRSSRMLKWITLKHAASLLGHTFGMRSAQRFTNRLSSRVALPYPSDDLFWSLFQKI